MSRCPHIDLGNPDNYIGGVPFEWLKELREKDPVHWTEYSEFREGGYWAITTHEDLDYVSKNPMLFSSAERTCMMMQVQDDMIDMQKMILINMDPPDHIQHRRIVRRAFTPKVVDSYHQHFEDVAKDIVDRVASKGSCEFVQQVSAELPLIAICELMGVPIEHRHKIFEWTNVMIGADDPDMVVSEDEANLAMGELFMFGHQMAADYREAKDGGKEFSPIMEALLEEDEDGEKLSADEFSTFFLILLVAGNETTRTVTAQGMRLLMEHPEQLQMLVDDISLLEDAIEEMLRYHTAVVSFRRTAMEDVTLPSGHGVKKGDNVVVYYHSASRDEKVFENPEVFDITRQQREDVRNKHRAFGIGEHFCMGSHLARLELKVIFEQVIPRIRNPKLAQPISWLRSNFINGIKEMHIEFDKEAS